MSRDLAARTRSAGVILSPSLLALPDTERHRLTRERARLGEWVHADVIAGSFLGQPGISLAEIDDLASIPDVLLDVHLMVDDPVDVISRLPPTIARITVQIPPSLIDIRAVLELVRGRGAEAWIGVNGERSDGVTVEVLRSANGVLVMLTPPGQPGHQADLSRLSLVAESLGMTDGPVGVDGGVNRSNLNAIIDAGCTYVVVGRAFDHREVMGRDAERDPGSLSSGGIA